MQLEYPEEAKKLEKNYRKILVLITFLVSFLASLLVSIPLVIASFIKLDSISPWLSVLLSCMITILLIVSLQIYVRKWYVRYRYWLTDDGLYILKGVWWQSITLIPRNRVQHIDISSGPLDRRYDLAKLTVHTAGTSNASVNLPGLLQASATQLRSSLLNLEEDDII